MPAAPNRDIPLVLVAVTDAAAFEPMATRLRREGLGLAFAVGDGACLRVATAVYPDIILLDPRLSRSLLGLLRAHPLSRRTQISWSRALEGSTPNIAR
jgi:hypothetical protein